MIPFTRKQYIRVISTALIFCLVTLTAGYADSIQNLKANLRVPSSSKDTERITKVLLQEREEGLIGELGNNVNKSSKVRGAINQIKSWFVSKIGPINRLTYERGFYPFLSSIIFTLFLLQLSTAQGNVNTFTTNAFDHTKGAFTLSNLNNEGDNKSATDRHNPIIKELVGKQTIKLGGTFSIEIIAEAPYGGEPLKYVVANGPGEMKGNTYTWTPREEDVGSKRVILAVVDKDGHVTWTRPFTLYIQQSHVSVSVLLQNYPNPAALETWIPYQLKEGADVTIKIYSPKGQLVRTLNLGYKEAGRYVRKDRAAYWDGKNERGEDVAASGVYFYTIKAGRFTAIRKMTVISGRSTGHIEGTGDMPINQHFILPNGRIISVAI